MAWFKKTFRPSAEQLPSDTGTGSPSSGTNQRSRPGYQLNSINTTNTTVEDHPSNFHLMNGDGGSKIQYRFHSEEFQYVSPNPSTTQRTSRKLRKPQGKGRDNQEGDKAVKGRGDSKNEGKEGVSMKLEPEPDESQTKEYETEKQIAQLIAERDQAKFLAEQLGAQLKKAYTKQEESERTEDLLTKERDAAKQEVEKLRANSRKTEAKGWEREIERHKTSDRKYRDVAYMRVESQEAQKTADERKKETDKVRAVRDPAMQGHAGSRPEHQFSDLSSIQEKLDGKQTKVLAEKGDAAAAALKGLQTKEHEWGSKGNHRLTTERNSSNPEKEQVKTKTAPMEVQEEERVGENEMSRLISNGGSAKTAESPSQVDLEKLRAEGQDKLRSPTYEDELRATKVKLATLAQEHEDTKRRLAAKIAEVEGTHMFTTMADKVSVGDVVGLLGSLNAEIHQASSIIAYSLEFPTAGQDQVPEHELMKAEAELMTASGEHITDALLRLRDSKEQNPDQGYDPTVLGYALQIAMTGFCDKTVNEWAPTSEANEYLENAYTTMQTTGSQAVAGRWRALTRAQLGGAQSQELLIENLACQLTHIMVVAGSSQSQIDNFRQDFLDNLVNIAELIIQIRAAVGEFITSVDVTIYSYSPGAIFSMDYMEDMYGEAGPGEIGAAIAGTMELGVLLQKRQQAAEQVLTECQPVVKAKVLLASILSGACGLEGSKL